MYKSIMVGYAYNHTRETYKFYNPETKRVVMTRDINWVEPKITDPAETMKMFRDLNKYDLVSGIDRDKTPTSYPEESLPVRVIPDEVESAR